MKASIFPISGFRGFLQATIGREKPMSGRKTAIATFVLILVFKPTLFAQIRSATITGTVKDATGAVVPDAAVIVTQQETGISTAIKTTASGVFTAPYLAAGTYAVA